MGREIFVAAGKEQNNNTLALGHSEVDWTGSAVSWVFGHGRVPVQA